MSKAFASQADLEDKKITFEQLSPHCWAYTAEGDPNSGVIIGEKYIMVSDATATPAMARDLIAQIRTVSDKPIKYVLLTHYHAVRVLGASAYVAEGATEIIATEPQELAAHLGAGTPPDGDACHGIAADRHYQLQQYGVKKRAHEDFDPVQAALVLEQVEADQQAQPLARAREAAHG